MKYFLYLVLAMVFSCDTSYQPSCEDCGFQCINGDEKDLINNACLLYDDCSFSYYSDAKIDSKKEEGIGFGDQNVFRLTRTTEAVEGIRQRVDEVLLIEVDASLRTFRINKENFSGIRVQFQKTINGESSGFVPAKGGCVAGEQQAFGVWFLYGKILIPSLGGDEEIKFEARFDLP